jgi:endonuclease III
VRESKAAKRQRARAIVQALEAAYPHSQCALRFDSPFQLLVATVLSAQTTDVAVNAVTRTLFARWPTAASLAKAPLADVEAAIQSIGLWRTKAKNIRALAQGLVADHEGQVPRELDALVALPGVGRKTATAVLGTAYGIAAGVTVDTHMLRINRLLGLSRAKSPDRMATELEDTLPPESWTSYTHRIIDHGRLVCVAGRPRCGVCPLASLCPSAFKPPYKESYDGRVPASAAGLSWLRD